MEVKSSVSILPASIQQPCLLGMPCSSNRAHCSCRGFFSAKQFRRHSGFVGTEAILTSTRIFHQRFPSSRGRACGISIRESFDLKLQTVSYQWTPGFLNGAISVECVIPRS
jgi:hypothetical protein